jgi:hypothetical protein
LLDIVAEGFPINILIFENICSDLWVIGVQELSDK